MSNPETQTQQMYHEWKASEIMSRMKIINLMSVCSSFCCDVEGIAWNLGSDIIIRMLSHNKTLIKFKRYIEGIKKYKNVLSTLRGYGNIRCDEEYCEVEANKNEFDVLEDLVSYSADIIHIVVANIDWLYGIRLLHPLFII